MEMRKVAFTRPWLPAGLVLIFGAVGLPAQPPVPEVQDGITITQSGQLHYHRHREVSGMAASRRYSKTLWLINDSGSRALLHAVALDGKDLGYCVVEGIRNRDWEDLASFELNGKPYLAIGEIGDNKPKWKTSFIYILEEPKQVGGKLPPKAKAKVAWKVEFRYPSGPRDAEALAVDSRNGYIYLITKFEMPKQLYRLPLRPPEGQKEPLVAEKMGPVKVPVPLVDLNGFDEWKEALRSLLITAMDYDARNHRLSLLTYNRVLLYQGKKDESWVKTLRREPVEVFLPPAPQYEAMCFSRYDKNLYVTTESIWRSKVPPKLLRLQLPDLPAEDANAPKKGAPGQKAK